MLKHRTVVGHSIADSLEVSHAMFSSLVFA